MDPESVARDGGRPSLNDFLEQFERMVNERRELAARLAEVLHENAALHSEILSLRTQLGSRLDSRLVTEGRLMREEFERKYQDLVVEVRRERTRNGQLIDD